MPQSVGNWIAKCRKQHADAQQHKSESEAQDLARAKAERHKAKMEL
ncbi:hypothetical protein [Actinomyces qiguomingii]|nr:hypothetical protein [Actinomyces qiguomingii]